MSLSFVDILMLKITEHCSIITEQLLLEIILVLVLQGSPLCVCVFRGTLEEGAGKVREVLL